MVQPPGPPVIDVSNPRLRPADAKPDLGDSAITETAGSEPFAMAGAPGFGIRRARPPTRRLHAAMYDIKLAKPEYTIPASLRGTPTNRPASRRRERRAPVITPDRAT